MSKAATQTQSESTDEIILTDNTGFRRDLLFAIAALEQDMSEPHGLAIKSYLEDDYREEINHSRLYTSLDKLVDRRLVEKNEIDGRTNAYILTSKGCEVVQNHAERRAKQVGLME